MTMMQFEETMYDTPMGCFRPWIDGDTYLQEAPDRKEYLGFVYFIHNPELDLNYYGRKLFWTNQKRPPLKGKTNKRWNWVQTDWETYWGSSEQLKADLKRYPPHTWDRFILRKCKTKAEMQYYEAKFIFADDALLRPNFYNSGIRITLHGKSLQGMNSEFA